LWIFFYECANLIHNCPFLAHLSTEKKQKFNDKKTKWKKLSTRKTRLNKGIKTIFRKKSQNYLKEINTVIHKRQFCKVDNPFLSTIMVDNLDFLYTV